MAIVTDMRKRICDSGFKHPCIVIVEVDTVLLESLKRPLQIDFIGCCSCIPTGMDVCLTYVLSFLPVIFL